MGITKLIWNLVRTLLRCILACSDAISQHWTPSDVISKVAIAVFTFPSVLFPQWKSSDAISQSQIALLAYRCFFSLMHSPDPILRCDIAIASLPHYRIAVLSHRKSPFDHKSHVLPQITILPQNLHFIAKSSFYRKIFILPHYHQIAALSHHPFTESPLYHFDVYHNRIYVKAHVPLPSVDAI